jgi:ectoine hydroxylase-related dioxygenase (phytanoyl-CoA dioxygenase family)
VSDLADSPLGYAIIGSAISELSLNAVVHSLAESMTEGGRAGHRHLMRVPAVRRLAMDTELRQIASRFIGQPAIPFKATLFDKSSTANWLVAWHQDISLPVHRQVESIGWTNWSIKDGVIFGQAPAEVLEKIVALRVHLDGSTTGNGPLRVLPGTHRHGRLTAEEIARFAREVAPVECLARAGGVVAMRPLLIHSSTKSTSGAQRRVLHIEYAPSLQVAPDIELAIA